MAVTSTTPSLAVCNRCYPDVPVGQRPSGLQVLRAGDGVHAVRRRAYHAAAWNCSTQPIATAEFLVVDTETNGLGGDACELTEVGAVLVGGGELHDRWASLVRTSMPLRRGIQRFTGITQEMVDGAPPLEAVLPAVERRLRGRVMVAHNAPFDRRVLRQAFDAQRPRWPDPPVLCTAALARTMLPLQRARRLGALADALGIDVERRPPRARRCRDLRPGAVRAVSAAVRAMPPPIAEALALLRPGARRRRHATRPARTGGGCGPGAAARFRRAARATRASTCSATATAGRCTSASRSRSAPEPVRTSPRPRRGRTGPQHAAIVDYRTTRSELGALVLENRLIKELGRRETSASPAATIGSCTSAAGSTSRSRSWRSRPSPAAGHAVTIGPLRGRRLALELVEQLDSLFGLRHCGRRLPRREHPSAYGQMGRCLSPCLGDLDPNLYRRRLDAALGLFLGAGDSRPAACSTHVQAQMREAAAAATLRAGRVAATAGAAAGGDPGPSRRRARGDARPAAAGPRRAPDRRAAAMPSGWSAAGSSTGARCRRTPTSSSGAPRAALARGGRVGELGAHVPPGRGRRGADRRDLSGLAPGHAAARARVRRPSAPTLRAFAGQRSVERQLDHRCR